MARFSVMLTLLCVLSLKRIRKLIVLPSSKGLGIFIVQVSNLFETIWWQIVSIPFNSPTSLSPWKTARPTFSILVLLFIRVSFALISESFSLGNLFSSFEWVSGLFTPS